jgi:hypothetical protein
MAAVLEQRVTHEELYRARAGSPTLVEVPPARFLRIDGAGAPGGERFKQALSALYSLAYTLKFSLKKAGRADFKVPPLEGLFGEFVEPVKWTLMIRMPDAVGVGDVEAARLAAGRKRELPALAEVRFEEFDEGLCAQVLHLGPYSEEAATIDNLHRFVRDQGHRPRGRHHEIYLSVPGRTKPERMKTLLRQPVDQPPLRAV